MGGMLVGLLTEAFLPKVLFFGWHEGSIIIGGVAWFETLVLTLFYHPVFSFMVPVYIAKRCLGYPLNLPVGRPMDYKVIGVSLWMTLSAAMSAIHNEGRSVEDSMVSLLILGALIVLLRFMGRSESAVLSKKVLAAVVGVGIVTYVGIYVLYEVPHGGYYPPIIGFLIIALYILVVCHALITRIDHFSLSDSGYQANYRIGGVSVILLLLFIGVLYLASYLSRVIGIAVNYVSLGTLVVGIVLGGIYFFRHIKSCYFL